MSLATIWKTLYNSSLSERDHLYKDHMSTVRTVVHAGCYMGQSVIKDHAPDYKDHHHLVPSVVIMTKFYSI